jgi:hypothetical protein
MMHTLYLLRILFLWLFFTAASSSSSSSGSFLLRIRLPDGSVERLQVSNESSLLTLEDLLKPLNQSLNNLTIQVGTQSLDPSQTLPSLNLSHGALISLRSSVAATKDTDKHNTSSQLSKTNRPKYNPFPELAKDYASALRRHQRQRRSSNSFAALADLRKELHVIEPQPTSTVQRLYMCAPSAERFFQQQTQQPALLLGTVVRERQDPKRRPKTSLSSTTEAEEMCVAAKVHAIYPRTDFYNLQSKARLVATWLGLRPIGWIFTYADDRHANDGLPMHVPEIVQAAQGQMQYMQFTDKDDLYPTAWVTCAMDATSGATEVFQLSDVAVQMVAEDVFDTSSQKNQRQAYTRHPVLVEGQEVNEFDSVLCLVNTALLSHTGWYGSSTNAVSTKTGRLLKKARKGLRQALTERDSASLLSQLCSFSTILALYEEGLSENECQALCRVVQKWTRGQKKGTKIDEALWGRLEKLVELP